MLKLKIIVVDRTRSRFLQEGELFYLKRLRGYAEVEWLEVKPVAMTKGKSEGEVLAWEAEAITRGLLPREYLVALDRSGTMLDSEGVASWLQKMSLSRSRLTFLIGGPLGISRDLLGRSQEILSLSKLTFTHEMSRVLLLEQLYRAFTIQRGEKYHK
jgi:23S rRNA (pseudouridine1915-N3)-methyltransferase